MKNSLVCILDLIEAKQNRYQRSKKTKDYTCNIYGGCGTALRGYIFFKVCRKPILSDDRRLNMRYWGGLICEITFCLFIFDITYCSLDGSKTSTGAWRMLKRPRLTLRSWWSKSGTKVGQSQTLAPQGPLGGPNGSKKVSRSVNGLTWGQNTQYW